MKNSFLYIIIGILILVIYLTTCKHGCNKVIPIIKNDTITIKDTTYLPGDTITVLEYVPVKGNVTKPKIIPTPNKDLEQLTEQYVELAEKHYSEVTYSDSVKLKDDRFKNTDLGTVYIKDVVSENELKSRDVKYNLKFPIINNTTIVTNTIEAKKKIQIYAGFGLTGNKYQLINGINSIFSLKTKQDVIYSVTAGYQYSFSKVYPQFGASVQFKIGKRK